MKFIYRLAWIGSRLAFHTYFRWRVNHAERVPLTGPVILVSNHASYMDPLVAGAGLSRLVNFLARDTLFRFPVMGWLLRSLCVVPVDREGGGASGLKAILERLRNGEIILIYPEGTRTLTGELQPARSGIGLVVIKSQAPVIPTRVFGTFEAYGRQAWFPKPGRLAVTYGWPLDFQALRAEAETCSKPRLKQIYQQIADTIMASIAALRPDGQ